MYLMESVPAALYHAKLIQPLTEHHGYMYLVNPWALHITTMRGIVLGVKW